VTSRSRGPGAALHLAALACTRFGISAEGGALPCCSAPQVATSAGSASCWSGRRRARRG
jgi:hypothetical protein